MADDHNDTLTPGGAARRRVLKGMAAGSLAAAGSALAGKAAAAPKRNWALQKDVVVVGSGIAGTCAAIAAAQNGASVVILEKMGYPGGTTRKSGGVFWIPNNPWLRAQGIEDEKRAAMQYMVRCAFPIRYLPDHPTMGLIDEEFALLTTFYDQGTVVLEKLMQTAGFDVIPWLTWDNQPFPDYYAHLPENKVKRGRSIVAQVENPEHVLWKENGASGYGLLAQLRESLPGLGVETRVGHWVKGLTRADDGRVDGVHVETDDGGWQALRARKGVVFCSGGFSQNAELCRQFLKGHIWGSCSATGSTGDFIPIAIQAGAALGNTANAWWGQVPLEQALKSRSIPVDVWSTPGDSVIQVNRYGRRFVNEKIQYDERTQAHFYWDPVHGEYPNLLSFMIWDARTAKYYAGRNPIPAQDSDSAILIEGAHLPGLVANIQRRLAGLADQIGALQLDPDFLANLRATFQRFNAMAVAGQDLDFHRGETPIEIAFQFFRVAKAPNEYPNMTLYPFADTGPYYAAILGAGTLDTKGGAVVDPQGRVLDPASATIPGLYAAGNCVAHPAYQAYWGGGGTIGPALTYGYLAGEAAAKA